MELILNKKVMSETASFLNGANPLRAPIAQLLLQIVVIGVTSKLLAIPLKYLRQPVVIAEVVAGILLGPSALSQIPSFKNNVFPDSSKPILNVVAQLGLILYLFLVGMELDPRRIKDQLKKSVPISLSGIALPFVCGVGVSYVLYNHYPSTTTFLTYCIFLGVAFSITAFPVLARILSERKLLVTEVGQTCLAAAAVDDGIAWILLGLSVSLIKNPDSAITALYVFFCVFAWGIFLWFAVRPLYVMAVELGNDNETYESIPVVFGLLIVLISAFFTQAVGLDAIFGGFLAGLITPHDHGFAIKLTEKIEDLVAHLLLPLYFTYSGLNTRIDQLSSGFDWLMILFVYSAATFGKFMGCFLSSYASGFKVKESVAVGVLMNTKGLVELIVLNLGLSAGVISQQVFTIFVMMALLTTLITVPVSPIVKVKFSISSKIPVISSSRPFSISSITK